MPAFRRHRRSSSMSINRRGVLQSALWGASALAFAALHTSRAAGAAAPKATRDLRVKDIRRTTVRVPYREVPERAMDRELPHWRYSEICEVELASGHVGFGETLLYYTWGATGDEDVERAKGRNAVEIMWDDSLGAGLQMALFDAVARAQEVPVHRLLGNQVSDKTPLSWWNIDMPPEDMASECRTAYDAGYMSYKTKGRPWFDLWAQMVESVKVVPESFKIDMDYNETLLDADRAIPILKELEAYPQIDIYEGPIAQKDVEGNARICEATRVNVALHYGTPTLDVCVREKAADGFVVSGGAQKVIQQGHACAEVDLPFWLQLVGTGVTAAFSLHLGAVLTHAKWPAVNCHQLYTHSLLSKPIEVKEGFAAIPDTPGLGYELDRDAIEHFRIEKPKERPEPERMVETTWPDGRRMYTANSGQVNFMLETAMRGEMPFFEKGVDSKLLPDDGSARWRELYEKSRKGPYLAK